MLMKIVTVIYIDVSSVTQKQNSKWGGRNFNWWDHCYV